MGVIEQRDKYTKHGHDSTVQMHIERLERANCEVIDVLRIKTMFLLWGENYTKIYFRKREDCKL